MYFKLEPQPVNHGDYALPRCALSGSGGISTPVPQLSAGSSWVLHQSGLGKAALAPLLVLGYKPIPGAFPSQQGIVSSPGRVPAPCPFHLGLSHLFRLEQLHAHEHVKTYLRSLQTLKTRVQNTPGGQFATETCSVSLWEHWFLGLFLLSDVIFMIIVFNDPNFIIVCTPRFSFLCSQTMTLY